MPDNRISTGNANDFTESNRGWFVGRFFHDDATAGPRSTDDVEVKWSVHPEGDERTDVAPGSIASTLTVLVSGRFEQIFPDDEPGRVVLEQPGDFAVFGPGVAHSWRALADSVMLTVRWPSPPSGSPQEP